MRRRFVVTAVLSLTLLAPASVLAADPVSPVPPNPANPPLVGQPPDDLPLPLTAAQSAELTRKLLRADELAAGAPLGSTQGAGTGCPDCTPYRTLPMYARQQANCYYCGPATGQVIINHSYGVYSSSTDPWSSSTNVHDQGTIAYHMWTTMQGTSGNGMANGLNVLARRPWNFTYYFTAAGNGAQWHAKVMTDISDFGMGLAAGVAPWETNASYRLSSWTAPAPGARHWIAIRGYWATWDGTRRPLVRYSDSAGGCGSGHTGNFSDPSLDVHYTIQRNSGMIVW